MQSWISDCVFTVATRLSFKAATELFITQPAVSKHIQELEEQYKVKLLIVQVRKFPDSGWRTISKTCQEYFEYREIDFEMSALIKEQTVCCAWELVPLSRNT
jgi:predicted transcriptional regulator